MDFGTRLRRITDLFVEGREVNLGDDPSGSPVLIWVNKLNSFEIEEARRDGAARRALRLAGLASDDAPERAALKSEVAFWTDDELADRWVNQKIEEHYLEALNDLDADPEWREKVETLRRLPDLLREANAAEDDPRQSELVNLQEGYIKAIGDLQTKKSKAARRDATDMKREDLEKSFFETWRQRLTLDEFMEERRVTELFYALRSCEGTRIGPNQFEHSPCNHHERALEDRGQVRHLPERVLEKCLEALENLTVPIRDAGNSDAPASSSASSEQPSAVEASTPSTPAETSPAPATT